MNHRAWTTALLLSLVQASNGGYVRYYLKVVRPLGDALTYKGVVTGFAAVNFTSSGSITEETKQIAEEYFPSWSFPRDYASKPISCSLATSPYTAYTIESIFSASSTAPGFQNQDFAAGATLTLPVDGTYNLLYTVYVGGAVPDQDDLWTGAVSISLLEYQDKNVTCEGVVHWTNAGDVLLGNGTPNQSGGYYWEYNTELPHGTTVHPSSIEVALYTNAVLFGTWSENFALSGIVSPQYDDIYQCVMSINLDMGTQPVDPEIPPMPIDPTDPPPPNDPAPPSTQIPGGDTDPDVALNYEAFRNAMEDALDNRALSGMEIHEAMQEALKEQGLSNEYMQNSMENALYNLGISKEDNRDAVQSALDRQGLSGSNIAANLSNALRNLNIKTDGLKQSELDSSLDARNLSADGIGQAVGSGVGQAFEEALGATGGNSYTGGGDPGSGTYDEAASDIGDKLGQMDSGTFGGIAGQIETKIRGMFVMQLPTVGQNPVFTVQLPSFMGIALPPLSVDLDELQYVPWVREVLSFCIYVGAFFKAMKIVGSTF